nr:unnamed protein product [Spirometra erinaceieuropaei]
MACVILLAASLFEILAVPESDLVLNICCNLALILLSASLNMLFMYVPELFPSEVRTQGLGLAAGIGRLGGVLCPFVNTLDSYVLHGLPVLVYAGILLIQLVNLAKLPDTSGQNLPDNVWSSQAENIGASLPATVISGLLYRLCKKRKLPIAVLYTVACVILLAASLFEILAVPESDLVLNICCNLALILLSASLNMLFMYVPELFPSEVRTQGLGLAAGIGRLGGVLCPFVNTLDSYVLHGLPVLVYAGILLIQLVNLAKLPDTSGQNLPDNVWSSQAENIGASVSTISHQTAR